MQDAGVRYNGTPVQKVFVACSADRCFGCAVCAVVCLNAMIVTFLHPLHIQSAIERARIVLHVMMSAILLFEDKINGESLACLRDIERLAGKDCLTKGYAKIQRICAACAKIAEASIGARSRQDLGAFTRSAVLYVLQALRFMLQYEMVKAGAVTVECLGTEITATARHPQESTRSGTTR